MMRMTSVRRALVATAAFAITVGLVGCAAPGAGEDGAATGSSAQTADAREGFVYFHGMSHLGFSHDALHAGLGMQTLLAPAMTDAQLQAPIAPAVTSFLETKTDALVAGYSLGRIPVLRLMASNAQGMSRVVMIDPTYDSASALGGSGISGGIAKAWLDGDPSRSLLLVYGDVTREVGGEKTYVRELANHPQASLCYVSGDHERFRHDDMVAALASKDCEDLAGRLAAR
jgi:hypothetical protein